MPERVRIDRRFTLLMLGDEWNNSYKTEFLFVSYNNDWSLLEQLVKQLTTQWGPSFNIRLNPHGLGEFKVDHTNVVPIQFIDSTTNAERDSNILVNLYKVNPASPLASRLGEGTYHDPFSVNVNHDDVIYQEDTGFHLFNHYKSITLPLERVRTRPDGYIGQTFYIHACLVG